MKHRSFFPARVITVIALAFVLLAGSVSAQVVEPLAQDAPVEISAYEAVAFTALGPPYIGHWLEFTNTSRQAVVALSVGVISFDAFWDHIGTTTAAFVLRIEPGAHVSNIALDQFSNELTTYAEFGSSFAFVHRVRFEDGTVWRYSSVQVNTALVRQAPTAIFNPATLP